MTVTRIPIIGVMGSHQNPWTDLAQPLGAWIAAQGAHLLTGGGSGVMSSVAEAFCTINPRRGHSIGILPTDENPSGIFTHRAGYPNPWIEIPIITPLPIGNGGTISRNHVNILSSDAIVALPGSSGTIDEVTLALRFGKPLLCFGSQTGFAAFPTERQQTANFGDVVQFLTRYVQQL